MERYKTTFEVFCLNSSFGAPVPRVKTTENAKSKELSIVVRKVHSTPANLHEHTKNKIKNRSVHRTAYLCCVTWLQITLWHDPSATWQVNKFLYRVLRIIPDEVTSSRT